MKRASYDTNKTIISVGAVDLNPENVGHLYYHLHNENTMYVFGNTETYDYFLAQENPLRVAYSGVMRGANNPRVNGLFKTIVQNAINAKRLYHKN